MGAVLRVRLTVWAKSRRLGRACWASWRWRDRWRLTGGERGAQPELQAGDVIEHQVEECGCLAGVERCQAGS